MEKYKISVWCTTTVDLVVEANSLDEAKEKARISVNERFTVYDNEGVYSEDFGFDFITPYPTED